jgi:hypothetical protein
MSEPLKTLHKYKISPRTHATHFEGYNTDVVFLDQFRAKRQQSSSALLMAKGQLQLELLDICSTRTTRGWDGYDALPITNESFSTAQSLIDLFPLEIQQPTIFPTNSGGFSFEWTKGPKYLVIEIENEEISCVLLDSKRKMKKSQYLERFDEEHAMECDDMVEWVKKEFPLND